MRLCQDCRIQPYAHHQERYPMTNKLYGYSERDVKVSFDVPDALKNIVVSVQIEEVTCNHCFIYECRTKGTCTKNTFNIFLY